MKVVNYSVLVGAGVMVVISGIAVAHAVKNKKGWDIATGTLGILIGAAAFKYSLEKVRNYGTSAEV